MPSYKCHILLGRILTGLILFVLPIHLLAAESTYVVNKYSLPKAYNNSELFDMVRDGDGFVYLATAAGLMEWDGQSFKVYNSANTSHFLSDRIQNLYLTSNNDLWLIRRNHHITLKRGDLFETFELPSGSGALRMFLFDDHERPWALMDGVVFRFNSELQKFESFNELTGLGRIHLISMHPSGKQIFLTDSGFWEYSVDGLTKLLTNTLFPIDPNTILSVYFSEENTLFVGHLNGYFSVDLEAQQLIQNHIRTDERINRFVAITDDEFLGYSNLGTWSFGAQSESSKFTPYSDQTRETILTIVKTKRLGDLTIPLKASRGGSTNISGGDRIFIDREMMMNEIERPRFIYTDSENTFWVVTMNGSIYHFRNKTVTNLMATPAGEIRNVYSIVEALDGSMWYGCLINGVFREKNGEFTVWNHQNSRLPSNDVRYIYEDPADQTIYVGIYHDGLWRFTDNNWEKVVEIDELIPINSSVIEAMVHDPLKNRLIVGSNGGILIRDSLGWGTFEPQGAENLLNIKVIRPSTYSELFFGTAGHGITLLDSNDRHIWTLTTDQGLSSDFIRDIYFQSSDTLWVATENNGLSRLILGTDREPKEIKHLGLADGLSNSRIHRILADEYGYLWISSNYGIMAVNVNYLNDYLEGSIDFIPMFYIDENSGMLNPEANGGVDNAGINLRNGHITIPTQSGIVIIDPQSIINSYTQGKPRPIIREIRSGDSIYYTNYSASLTLPLGERDFTAFFQAPLFNNADYRRVRYKLNGVDTHWRYLEDNFEVWYTRINPGSYELNVQITDPYGSQELTTLAVLIPSYIYERTWFQIFATVAMVVFIVFGTRYGYGKKLEMNEIRHLVNLQTKDLQKLNEEKSRFFTSIIHEMKTPVALIMNNVDLLFSNSHDFNVNNQTKPLNRLQRNSYKLLMLIDTLSGIAKLQNKEIHFNQREIHIVQATQLIIAEAEELLKEKNLTLRFITDPELENATAFLDLEAWERILTNLMNNIINYSPMNGLIEIKIQKKKDLVIQISDERPEFETDDSDDFFGYFKQDYIVNSTSGSSFGLYLAKELLTRQNGTISVLKNVPMKSGLTFRLTIPKSSNTYSDTIHNDTSIKTSDTTNSDIYTLNESSKSVNNYQKNDACPEVLFVDDNIDYREYIVSELQSDYNVTAVGSASEALEMLEKVKPDLIISDIMMPHMSGYELVTAIRKKESFKTVPVIFLSALDSDLDIHTGLSAGADVYLTKEVKIQILKLQIQALLRREKDLALSNHQVTVSEPNLTTDIKQLIYRNLGNTNLGVDMIAEFMFISRATLYRRWNDENDISIQQYIMQTRLNEAHSLLANHNISISDAALITGFSDSSYFSTSFKKLFGFSPSDLNK